MVGSIGGVTSVITEMRDIADHIATSIEAQSAATREIAQNVEQATYGTSQVSNSIGGVNAAAGQTGNAAEQVLGSSQAMSARADELRQTVQKFIPDIRMAQTIEI